MKLTTIARAAACATFALAGSLVAAQTNAPRPVGPAANAAAERAPVNFNGIWEMLDAKAVTRPGGPKAPYT